MLKSTFCRFILIISGVSALFGSGLASAQMDESEPMMNYHRLNERLVTGGHLLENGAAVLKEQGVQVVISLRDDSPTAEEQQFAEQGIEWINIPVEWRNPEAEEFERFSALMREHEGDHVLVQCSSNYRASAMTYLYQVTVENVPEEEAIQDVLAIWDPDDNATWSAFFEAIKTAGQ